MLTFHLKLKVNSCLLDLSTFFALHGHKKGHKPKFVGHVINLFYLSQVFLEL